ncbi:hypothetical protein FJZ21_01135 [Candidatus Pacearchaeota archaeon]|nr:hypothetical protein [Candidatus Pacearchaeota archaeon]
MVKRDDYEEDEDLDNSKTFALDKLTVISGVLFILICELFLYFLSTKTDATFGLTQIMFGAISGIVLTLYLIWTRFIMASNRFLGLFLSLGGIISVGYALTRKYQGFYTTTFLIIGIILALFYTIFYFIKSDKK